MYTLRSVLWRISLDKLTPMFSIFLGECQNLTFLGKISKAFEKRPFEFLFLRTPAIFPQHCDCVAYYMPRNPNQMPICAPEKSVCVDEAITIVEESAFEGAKSAEQDCRCLPSCTDMEFPHETSVSKVARSELINVPKEVKGTQLSRDDD